MCSNKYLILLLWNGYGVLYRRRMYNLTYLLISWSWCQYALPMTHTQMCENIFFFLVPVLVCSAHRQAAEIADGSRQCDCFYKKFTFYPDVFVVAVSYFDHKAFFHALLKCLLKLEEKADSSERLYVRFGLPSSRLRGAVTLRWSCRW